MFKKIQLALFGLLSAVVSTAQPVLPTSNQIEAFYKTKTLVVLEPELFSPYNIFIKEAVEKYWYITPVDVIDYEEFGKLRKDTTYSFLTVSQTRYDKDKSKILYNYLDLMMGANVPTLTEMPLMGSLPLSYPDAEEENYSYKLGVMVRFLQDRVENLKQHPGISGMKNLKYYNKNSSEIRNHVLLLTPEDLPPRLQKEGELNKYYHYPYRLVSKEKLESIIEKGVEDVVFLHVIGPGNRQREGWSFKLIYGLKDARLYYYSKHIISDKKPNGFLISDWKKISR